MVKSEDSQGSVGWGLVEWKWEMKEKLKPRRGDLLEMETGRKVAQRVFKRLMSASFTDSSPGRKTEGAVVRLPLDMAVSPRKDVKAF